MKAQVAIFCMLVDLLAAEKFGACPDVKIVTGGSCITDYDCGGEDKCCGQRCAAPTGLAGKVNGLTFEAPATVSIDVAELSGYERSRSKRAALDSAWESLKTLRKKAKALRKKQKQIARKQRQEAKRKGTEEEVDQDMEKVETLGGTAAEDGTATDSQVPLTKKEQRLQKKKAKQAKKWEKLRKERRRKRKEKKMARPKEA